MNRYEVRKEETKQRINSLEKRGNRKIVWKD